MSIADTINGSYESIGGLFMFFNCLKVYKDKQVKGISLISAMFFCSWSWWNLYYYPSLNQWISFTGGLIITITNTSWIAMAIYYSRKR